MLLVLLNYKNSISRMLEVWLSVCDDVKPIE